MTPLKLHGATRAFAAAGLAALLLASAGGPAPAAGMEDLSEEEKAAFEEMIRDYILENPEIVEEALRKLQQREQAREAERQQQAITQNLEALRNDPNSPVIGNPDGDVTIVEFFDYRCPYCKQVADDLRNVVEEDGDIRLVMKELPILSKESETAAKAALAAQKQGRYEDFHFTLMTDPGSLSETSIFAVAEDLGLDLEQLRADMDSPEITRQLDEVYALAQQIGVRGTPAFVIGEELIPGAISIEIMREKVAAIRDGAS